MSEPTPTVYFPESSVDYQWSPLRGNQYSTEILTMRNGQEQRRRMFVDGPYEYWQGTTNPLNATARTAVNNFIDGRQGMYSNFYFFRPEPFTVTDYVIGSVASETSIILPGKESTITGVKVGGVTKTFTVTVGAGAGGEDRINFSGGAQTGEVTVTGTYRKRFIARFEGDKNEETFFQSKELLSVITIAVREVR